MPRPKLALLMILAETVKSLYKSFERQRIRGAYVLALIVFGVAMIFSFLAFSPVLSPFVYPLF